MMAVRFKKSTRECTELAFLWVLPSFLIVVESRFIVVLTFVFLSVRYHVLFAEILFDSVGFERNLAPNLENSRCQ